MGINVKNKKIAILAAAGAALVLMAGGIFAAKTVWAAERVMITSETSATRLHAMADTQIMEVYKNTFYGDTGCTLVLPTGYIANENIKGMYQAERYPLDSSNIYYTVTENIDAEVLADAMHSESYKERVQVQFKETYGPEATIGDYHMKELQISGCPACEIELSCQVGDMKMEQLSYVIMADKIYTITYSQSADDGRMEEFKRSAETIRVVFAEEK